MLFQPILQAYPTQHSWIVMAHISLGQLEHHWKLFKWQLAKTKQFLTSLEHHPSATPLLITTLQLDLANIQDLYKSHETIITSAVDLLNSNQQQHTARCKRSLLPFLGTALSWLTGTATTKDIRSIRTRINQLIATQLLQQDTLVHIVSILNVTRYATQVNRHSINSLIDAVHSATSQISICQPLRHHESPMHHIHTYDGLHQCWHIRQAVTSHSTSCRPTTDADTHCNHPTSNFTPTYLTNGHPTFLQILARTCPHREQTILIVDRHPHPGQSQTDHHSSSPYSGHPSW